MPCIANRFVVVLLAILPFAALADGSRITLGERVFDLRDNVSDLRRDSDFIPIRDVPWLNEYLDGIDAFAGVVFHIQELAENRLSAEQQQQWDDRHFPTFYAGDDGFADPRYSVRTYSEKSRMLLLKPKDADAGYFGRCGVLNSFGQRFCAVYADYGPDPSIRLLARVYGATSPDRFAELAVKMRRIARCLDVTEQQQAANQDLYDKNAEFMTDCVRVTS